MRRPIPINASGRLGPDGGEIGMFDLAVERKGDIWLLLAKGRIDGDATDRFNEMVDAAAKQAKIQLVLDFTEVDFIASAGLGAIVRARKLLGPKNVHIANANTTVKTILKATGLMDKPLLLYEKPPADIDEYLEILGKRLSSPQAAP